MAFRIHDSVVRGEIDNRQRGVVRGKVWVHGRAEPVVLELRGNAHPDLAGCLLTFTNPQPITPHHHLDSLNPVQRGTIGDLTASRRVRVFDIPFAEALAMLERKEKPPEHMANSLYLEWFSDANGRVVIESADYQLTISAPEWRLTPGEDEQRAAEAEAGFEGFMGKVSQTLEEARFQPPEDRPMNEFEWEKSFKESDALTDKFIELQEKYGDREDFEEIAAREMGWDKPVEEDPEREAFDVEEMNRICEEAVNNPPQPNPLTEGVDWVTDKHGGISHPLEVRIRESSVVLWKWCKEEGLLGENGDADLHDMIFKLQCCGAKCAGALGGLAYEDDLRQPGFVVAGLKRALALLHESIAAAERVGTKTVLPADKLGPFREELFAVREQILALMERFRAEG